MSNPAPAADDWKPLPAEQADAVPDPDEAWFLALPTTVRIDLVLGVLSARRITPDGGWSLTELAELCGCSDTAILLRERAALRVLRQRTPDELNPNHHQQHREP